MRKTIFFCFGLGLFSFLMATCDNSGTGNGNLGQVVVDSTFYPVQMPGTSPVIPGWKFPEDSVVINRWVNSNDFKSIYTHGWGLWNALTAPTKESYNNITLLTFETWYTPEDVQAMMTQNLKGIRKRPRHNFQPLSQLVHGEIKQDQAQDVVGFVKWDPSAVKHIVDNKLLYASTLQGMQAQMDGKTAKMIPEFPITAVALKPVFQDLNQLPQVAPGVFRVPAWPGVPNPARPFDTDQWNSNIFVDTNNKGTTNNTGQTSDTMPVPGCVYGLGDFINFQADADMAKEMNNPDNPVNAGDYFVLLAMHITSKETKRWTWQTMFWSNNPANPLAPSSAAIAAARPASFQTPAAGRYAMAIAYSMVIPAQPYTGGSGANATSLYAFNPWLEGGFGKTVLTVPAKVGNVSNDYGVQTNCMSCHAYASYPGVYAVAGTQKKHRFYAADRYVDMQLDTVFTTLKNLQVDFLWSVQGNVIPNK